MNAATIMAPGWAHWSIGDLVTKDGKQVRQWDDKKFGAFVLPGNDGKPAPVFAGGSNIGISAKTKNPALAKDLMKIIFSDDFQKKLGGAGLGPANSDDVSSLGTDQFAKALIDSASSSKLTPAAPGWAGVEPKIVMEEFFGKIKDASDLAALAKEYDAKITPLLNLRPDPRGHSGGREIPHPTAGRQDRKARPDLHGDRYPRDRPPDEANGSSATRRRTPAWLVLPSLVLLVVALGYPRGVAGRHELPALRDAAAVRPAAGVGGLDNYTTLVSDPQLWAVVGRSVAFCLVCALTTVAIGPASPCSWARSATPPDRAPGRTPAGLGDARRRVDDGVDLDGGLAARPAELGARAGRGRRPGPQLAGRATVVPSSSRRHRRLDERAVRRTEDLRRTDPGLPGRARGGGDRRRGGTKRLRHIILPLMAPVMSIVLLLQIIWDLRVFTQVQLLQDVGRVANETHTCSGRTSTSWARRRGLRDGQRGLDAHAAADRRRQLVLRPLAHEGGVMSRILGPAAPSLDPRLDAALGAHGRRCHRRPRLGVPGLLDGQLRLPRQGDAPVQQPDLPALRRLVRQLRHCLQRRGFIRALGISLAVTLVTVVAAIVVAFLGRPRGEPLPVPRPALVRARAAADPDASGRGAVHRAVPDDEPVGLLNNVLGLALLYTAAVVPFTVWMLRGFVAGVPVELEEAAMVDGLSRTKAFLRITFRCWLRASSRRASTCSSRRGTSSPWPSS